LLEDDYDVDWEVDQDQRADLDHPHRAQLRNRGRFGRSSTGRVSPRRPGEPEASLHPCLSPISRDFHAPAIAAGRRKAATGAHVVRAAHKRPRDPAWTQPNDDGPPFGGPRI